MEFFSISFDEIFLRATFLEEIENLRSQVDSLKRVDFSKVFQIINKMIGFPDIVFGTI